MGWVEDLRGKTVGLDTSPLIFYIEEHVIYCDVLDPFFEAVKLVLQRYVNFYHGGTENTELLRSMGCIAMLMLWKPINKTTANAHGLRTSETGLNPAF